MHADWKLLELSSYELVPGIGPVPGARPCEAPVDGLVRCKSPLLDEAAVRDLFITRPCLLEEVLNEKLDLVLRELHRVDLVALSQNGLILVELKHHQQLRPDIHAQVQLARHREKTIRSIRQRVGDSWVEPSFFREIVMTSRPGRASHAIVRFVELRHGDSHYLAFTQHDGVDCPSPEWKADADPKEHGVELSDLLDLELPPNRWTRTVGPRPCVVLHDNGQKPREFVAVSIWNVPGGPFVALECSAKVADALVLADRGAVEPGDVCRACRAARESVQRRWSASEVVADDELLRTWWKATPSEGAQGSLAVAIDMSVELAKTFHKAMATAHD